MLWSAPLNFTETALAYGMQHVHHSVASPLNRKAYCESIVCSLLVVVAAVVLAICLGTAQMLVVKLWGTAAMAWPLRGILFVIMAVD
jgi:hypothetical protein